MKESELKIQIGSALLSARKAKRLTMRQASAMAGITEKMLNNMEKAKSNYTIDSLLKYSELLGLKFQPLVGINV